MKEVALGFTEIGEVKLVHQTGGEGVVMSDIPLLIALLGQGIKARAGDLVVGENRRVIHPGRGRNTATGSDGSGTTSATIQLVNDGLIGNDASEGASRGEISGPLCRGGYGDGVGRDAAPNPAPF